MESALLCRTKLQFPVIHHAHQNLVCFQSACHSSCTLSQALTIAPSFPAPRNPLCTPKMPQLLYRKLPPPQTRNLTLVSTSVSLKQVSEMYQCFWFMLVCFFFLIIIYNV